jgi:hypothetical protein
LVARLARHGVFGASHPPGKNDFHNGVPQLGETRIGQQRMEVNLPRRTRQTLPDLDGNKGYNRYQITTYALVKAETAIHNWLPVYLEFVITILKSSHDVDTLRMTFTQTIFRSEDDGVNTRWG